MNDLDIRRKFNLNKVKKDLHEYFKDEVFELKYFDEINEKEKDVIIDVNQITLISVRKNFNLQDDVLVIPYELKVVAGDNIVIEDGTYWNENISLSLEYNEEEELTSVSW